MTIDPAANQTHRQAAFIDRLSASMVATLDLLSVYLGERLGYYRVLAHGEALTSVELSAETGTDERYTREWLEHQAVTDILVVEQDDDDPTRRTYALPAPYVEPLTDPDSLNAITPSIRSITSLTSVLPQLLDAYKSGAGVPFDAYGDDMGEGQAGSTRPLFRHLLTTEWLPQIPDLHEQLLTKIGARVADIGMGHGWSSIAIAQAYPGVIVDGFDLDPHSVETARANARDSGVADRVQFHLRNAGDPELAGRYDLAFAFECLHDMANPVAALQAMRRLVGPGGTIVIADERVEDQFVAPGNAGERLNYGYSILHCLPVGRVDTPSVGTGAVMRASTLRRYAEEAGCQAVEVVPIEHDGYRFYRLTA